MKTLLDLPIGPYRLLFLEHEGETKAIIIDRDGRNHSAELRRMKI